MQLGQTHDVNRWYASCNLTQRMMQIKAMDITNVCYMGCAQVVVAVL